MGEHRFCANSALSSLRQLTPEGLGALEQIPTGLRAPHSGGLSEHPLWRQWFHDCVTLGSISLALSFHIFKMPCQEWSGDLETISMLAAGGIGTP